MSNKRKKSRARRTYRRRADSSFNQLGSKCVFCGSSDVTVHHIVYKRYAPELINEKSNQIPMCSRCQKTYHYLEDILLSYLTNKGKLSDYEIREREPFILTPIELPKPPPNKEEVKNLPPIYISGGQVTINFN